MDIINSEFYGDDVRWFIGVIEEVGQDEPKLGRVKVRIYGIHGDKNEVPLEDLPYAQTLIPTTEPGISGLGRNPYLGVSATVFGIFLDGKLSQLPLVLGSIPTMQTPSIVQINNQSQDEKFNTVIKKSQGFSVPGTPGSGTGGRTGIASALAYGLDSFVYDPNAPAGTNVQIAWEFFKSLNKYSDAAIAGMIGNFLAESDKVGAPIDIEPTAKGDIALKTAADQSFGIAQWYNAGGNPESRYAELVRFAERINRPKEDLITQLAYVDWELSNIQLLKGEEFKRKPTATLAAIHFRRNYEIPAFDGNKLSPVDGQRMRLGENKAIKYSKMVYNHFTRKINTTAES